MASHFDGGSKKDMSIGVCQNERIVDCIFGRTRPFLADMEIT
jgi:hypothetical protein